MPHKGAMVRAIENTSMAWVFGPLVYDSGGQYPLVPPLILGLSIVALYP